MENKENNAKETEQLDDDLKWYCIRTFTGHENRIKQAIEAEIKRLELQDKISDVVVLETTYEEKKGKTKTRNFLSGYILIKANLDKKIIDMVTSITGVMNFLGRKNAPAQLQLSEVERIFEMVEGRSKIDPMGQIFNVNESVKVIDGPFTGFSGVIKEVHNNKQKLKVEVGILGRKTPIELDFVQVEKFI